LVSLCYRASALNWGLVHYTVVVIIRSAEHGPAWDRLSCTVTAILFYKDLCIQRTL
jgi:hypothetical protein